METVSFTVRKNRAKLYNLAYLLAVITIGYNIVEGIVSVFFGLDDETVALFGFGLDSFVEVISGIGIWHMIRRLRKNQKNLNPDRFEQQALRITGSAFYLLTTGLVIVAVANLVQRHSPETTFWGIIVSSVSIITMWLLIRYKLMAGRELNSEAIIADANCTKTCMYLSIVLLLASLGYEFTGIGSLDSIGALIIAWFSFKEGREAFQKAAGKMTCSCQGSCK
ncbi:MAG: cation transporter [Nitrospirota bacterium]|nr:cation transporter [Nitrospirota bacterium]